MHLKRHLSALIATVGLICSGCGQTGALYLPDQKPQSVPADAAESNSEAAEMETEERENRRGTHEAPATDTETPVTPPDPDRPTQTPQGPGDR